MSQLRKQRLIVLAALMLIIWFTSAGVRNLLLWRRIDAQTLVRMPLVRQGEYKTPIAVIGGAARSVRSSGCGAVCIAMASGYLHGSNAPSPEELFRWAYEQGYYTGNGLGHEAMTALARQQHVQSKWIGADANRIRHALLDGYPVIAHMGPGTFTRNGHYILLRGIDAEGMILVNDPGSVQRTGKVYPLSEILDQLRNKQAIMLLWV